MRKLIITLILLCGLAMAESGDALKTQVLLQEALYQENIAGNIECALKIYGKIAGLTDLSRGLQAQVQLRMALCHEKLGMVPQAESLYTRMIHGYPEMHQIVRMANSRLREHLRYKQISRLREQLARLKDSSLKEKLEQEIYKLQQRIRTLEKPNSDLVNSAEHSRSKTLHQQNAIAESEVEQKVGDLLSIHLYNVASNLYQKGLLAGARESLSKALHFNARNAKAKELLIKVEALLSQMNKPGIISKKSAEMKAKQKADKTPDNLSALALPEVIYSPEKEVPFVEESYNLVSLRKKWSTKDRQLAPEVAWATGLLKYIKEKFADYSWQPPAGISYQPGWLLIRQTPGVQHEIKNFWKCLIRQQETVAIKATLFQLSEQLTRIIPSKLNFEIHQSGIFYAHLSRQQQRTIDNLPTTILHQFREVFLLPEQKSHRQYLQDIFLVQGYNGQQLNFQNFKEGIQIQWDGPRTSDNAILVKIWASKANKPIETVPTEIGPVQTPCFINQQAEFLMELHKGNALLVGGLLNPYQNWQGNNFDNLYLLLTSEKIPVWQFVNKLQKQENGINSDRDYLQKYDIGLLQQVKDIGWNLQGEYNNTLSRNQFLLNFFQKQIGEKPAPLKIFQDFLLVSASGKRHEKISQLLDQLKSQAKTLCHFSTYLLSCDQATFYRFLGTLGLEPQKNAGLQVYVVHSDANKLIPKLKDFVDIKFEYMLSPAIVGNTQRLCLKDCRVRSFMDSIEHQENSIIQGKIVDIPEGLLIDIRPMIISTNDSTLEIATAIYQIRGSRSVVYALDHQMSISFKNPEVHIQRGYATVALQKGVFYILSGFRHGDTARADLMFFLLIPTIMHGPSQIPTRKDH